MSIAVQIDELKAWNKRVSDLRQRHESSAERLSLHYAALLLNTTSGDLDKALEAVRKAWETRDTKQSAHRYDEPNIGAGVRQETGRILVKRGEGVLPAKDSQSALGALETQPTSTDGVRLSNGPASRPLNKSTVNAQTLKSLTLFDTTTFDGRPIGDVRRGELKGYARRGKLAQAILDFGEAPDDFKVRDILRVSDLRKILLEVGEVQ